MGAFDEQVGSFRGEGFSINDIMKIHAELLRTFYVAYFLHCSDDSYDSFLNICETYVKNYVKVIDDIYADQVEGMRWKIMKKEEKNA